MIDFENREYLRISAYWKDWAICFVMKNGLAYMVSTKSAKDAFPIAVAICTDSHTKMNPYTDDVDTIPKAELDRAVHNLKNGKIANRFEHVPEHWLKWTNKYENEIANLALYYEEKRKHCPTLVDGIQIDFENRDYIEVAVYWPELYVCFVMQNSLTYCVDIESEKLYVDVHPYAFINDYGGFFKDAAEISRSELKKAEKVLKAAKLAKLSSEDIKAFRFWFQLHKGSPC